MGDAEKYQVVFLGLDDDAYPKDAVPRLARVLGVALGDLEQLLERAPIVVKEDLNAVTAEDYRLALVQSGGKARVEASLMRGPQEVQRPAPVEAGQATTGRVCAKCGYVGRAEELDDECPRCGADYGELGGAAGRPVQRAGAPEVAKKRAEPRRGRRGMSNTGELYVLKLVGIFVGVFVLILSVFILFRCIGG